MNINKIQEMALCFLIICLCVAVLSLAGAIIYRGVEWKEKEPEPIQVRVELVTPWDAHVESVSITAVDVKQECEGEKNEN